MTRLILCGMVGKDRTHARVRQVEALPIFASPFLFLRASQKPEEEMEWPSRPSLLKDLESVGITSVLSTNVVEKHLYATLDDKRLPGFRFARRTLLFLDLNRYLMTWLLLLVGGIWWYSSSEILLSILGTVWFLVQLLIAQRREFTPRPTEWWKPIRLEAGMTTVHKLAHRVFGFEKVQNPNSIPPHVMDVSYRALQIPGVEVEALVFRDDPLVRVRRARRFGLSVLFGDQVHYIVGWDTGVPTIDDHRPCT